MPIWSPEMASSKPESQGRPPVPALPGAQLTLLKGLMLPVACLGASQSQQPLDSFLHDHLSLWLQPLPGLCGPYVPSQSPPLSPPPGDPSAALLCSSREEVSGAGVWPLSLEPSADTLPKIAPLLLPTVPWRQGSEVALASRPSPGPACPLWDPRRGRPGPGGSLRPGPSRPSVGAHNTWAAWSTGFIGQKLSAEPRCTAAGSRLAPSPSDLGWSRRAPTARSAIWVPKEPELEARRLFLPPPLSCPGARGEGSATLDFAHGCTVAAFGPDSPGQAGSALRARAK